MQKLRVGAIGVGGMGRGHLLSAQACEEVSVVAVCDVSQAALDQVAGEGIRKYKEWGEFLDKEELDVVAVCLPHHLYTPVVTAALRRGMHVYKDKPFADTLAGAREMAAVSRECGRRLFVGAQRKFSPSFLQAKQIVDEGKLGRVHFVRGSIHYFWPRALNNAMGWRGQREESGGIAIIDSGYHILDAITAYHGKPATVFASTGRLRAVKGADYTIDDKAALILTWPDGSLGSVTISFVTVPGEFRVVLHGQEGTLDIDSSRMSFYTGSTLAEQMAVDDSKVNVLNAQFAHCVEALREGKPSLCDVERALEVQEVIEAAYESDRTGQVIAVG